MLSHPQLLFSGIKVLPSNQRKSRAARNLTERTGEKRAKKSPPGIIDDPRSWQGPAHMLKLHPLMGKKNQGMRAFCYHSPCPTPIYLHKEEASLAQGLKHNL